jgi:hypothetical protein
MGTGGSIGFSLCVTGHGPVLRGPVTRATRARIESHASQNHVRFDACPRRPACPVASGS